MIIHRGSNTAYAPFLINGFNAAGLTIRPALSQLQVVQLNASYTGDTMRVMVPGADGAVPHKITLSPDHDIINSKLGSSFFVQVAFVANSELQVTVTPLANQVYR